ncbi:lipooligosaccharide transport system permease protein [Salana multivorans]|uniref:Transport permease protein n=1 Tax=Salana multivorans TaxID=120377 RepID=A0A3N2D767_9MICO|nr:lipooligosaccharide transport system permease protein [Salana multivorans]
MSESAPADGVATVNTSRYADAAAIRVNAIPVGASLDERREAALAGARKPRRLGGWYNAEAFLLSMKAYGWTIIVGGVGSPLLYLLGLGLGLAAVIPVSVADGAAGPVSYVTFVAPALLVTATIGVASEEFTYPVMGGFKWRKTFFGIAATPVSPPQIVSGLVIAVVGRMLFVSVAYYALMVVFGAVPQPGLGMLSILAGLLAGLAFGLPLLAYASSIREDKGQFALVQRFIFTPLFLFSGTFYPLDTLPVWLHPIGWLSPVWHGAQLGRWATYGAPTPGWLLAVHALALVAIAAVAGYVAGRVFTRRLR